MLRNSVTTKLQSKPLAIVETSSQTMRLGRSREVEAIRQTEYYEQHS